MYAGIRQTRESLPRAERAVADYLLASKNASLTHTLADLALAAGVSEPTVLRFCRRLGCEGFSDFKIRLASEIGQIANDYVHDDILPHDSVDTVVQKIADRTIHEFNRVRHLLDTQALQESAERIARSRKTEFYAIGTSGLVAADAQNKFFRLGLCCLSYNDLPTLQQAAAITSTDDCVVLISRSGRSNGLIRAADLANDNGAFTIVVTPQDSPLASRAQCLIALDPEEDTTSFTPMSSRMAQLLVMDCLQVTTAIFLGEPALDNLTRSKSALA